MARELAIFDFDDTLTHGDTLGLWLAALAGKAGLYRHALLAGAGCWFAGRGPDRRTRFKDLLWRDILAGVTLEAATKAAESAMPYIRWRAETNAILRQHQAEGRDILIATGAARLCAEVFVSRHFGRDRITVMGTELEEIDGVLTGNMQGGNCVRAEKARLVAGWLEQHGPYERIYGYGNAPHDLAMLALVTDPNII